MGECPEDKGVQITHMVSESQGYFQKPQPALYPLPPPAIPPPHPLSPELLLGEEDDICEDFVISAGTGTVRASGR